MRYVTWILAITFVCLSIILFANANVQKIYVRQETEVCIEPYKDYVYKTCKPIVYQVEGRDIVVPSEYETDLASIPRIFWNIFSPARSEFMSAAILHDFLYRCHDELKRKEIDDIFFSLLIENGVSKREAILFYLGVRTFGKGHFSKESICMGDSDE